MVPIRFDSHGAGKEIPLGYRRAVAVNPDLVEGHMNPGNVLSETV